MPVNISLDLRKIGDKLPAGLRGALRRGAKTAEKPLAVADTLAYPEELLTPAAEHVANPIASARLKRCTIPTRAHILGIGDARGNGHHDRDRRRADRGARVAGGRRRRRLGGHPQPAGDARDRIASGPGMSEGSSVRSLLEAAGLSPAGVVPWGERPMEARPGVYVVALTDDPDGRVTEARAPVSDAAIAALLAVRPGLASDSVELARRVRGCWLADQTVVYVGAAPDSVATRVRAHDGNPDGGGWLLTTLAPTTPLHVHVAATDDPDAAAAAMLEAFAAGVSTRSRAYLHDSERVVPFANAL